jgi:capsular exopolysaccharide synthesis family protein
MTRIDDALRQVATLPVGDGAEPALHAPSVPPPEHVRLEHYPLEEPSRVARSVTDVPAGLQTVQILDRERPGTAAAPTRGEHPLPRTGGWAAKLVTGERLPELAVEQYRRLAAAIHDLQVKQGLKTVMVTSALPEDGKTLTVVNLALTLSESYGRRVLLVDGDLRHPSLQDIFDLPPSTGLGGFLRGEADEPDIVEITRHLHVLPAGRADANPMASLTSPRMRSLLDRTAVQFDWVLVDTPPLALLPDGQLLGALIKAVVFVIGAGTTPWPVVDKAVAELGRDFVVGIVLNGAEDSAMPGMSYYRRYYGSRESAQHGRSASSGA